MTNKYKIYIGFATLIKQQFFTAKVFINKIVRTNTNNLNKLF